MKIESSGFDVDEDLVKEKTEELYRAYLQVFYDFKEPLAEVPVELEDLIANIQAAIELTASMIATTSAVLSIASDADVSLDEIVAGILEDSHPNLDTAVKNQLEHGHGGLGQIIVSPIGTVQ